MIKKLLFFMLLALAATQANAQRYSDGRDTVYTVHSITQDQFKELVADYRADDWEMQSPRPVIIDFYADWCQPCRRLEPVLRQIAQYYKGDVDFYRINVDQNQDIAEALQIRSIPFLLICPVDDDPKGIVGLYSQQEYIRIFNQALNR